MNAAASNKFANCIVDRHSAWFDETTGLIWMLVRSRAAGIQKGSTACGFTSTKLEQANYVISTTNSTRFAEAGTDLRWHRCAWWRRGRLIGLFFCE